VSWRWPKDTWALGTRLLWEHPFQACAIDTECALRRETGHAEFDYFLCYFKMDAPRAVVFRPLDERYEALGKRLTRIKRSLIGQFQRELRADQHVLPLILVKFKISRSGAMLLVVSYDGKSLT